MSTTTNTENGAQKRTRVIYSPEDKALVLSMLVEGKKPPVISAETGVGLSTVINWKRQAEGDNGQPRKSRGKGKLKNLLAALQGANIAQELPAAISALEAEIVTKQAEVAAKQTELALLKSLSFKMPGIETQTDQDLVREFGGFTSKS